MTPTGGHGMTPTGGHGMTPTGGHGMTPTGGHGMTPTGGHGMTPTGGHGMTPTGGHGMTPTGGHGMTPTGGHGMTPTGGHGMTPTGGHGMTPTGGHGMTPMTDPPMTGHGMTPMTDPPMTGHGMTPTGGHGMPGAAATGAQMGSEISSYDRAVLIATEPQGGGITVTWEANEDTIIQKTASYAWQIGEVEFKKPVYDVNEKVTFHIRDRDLWIHHAGITTNYVNVYSDSDLSGIHVGVRFTPNMEHAKAQDDVNPLRLNEPAASSLTKYTEDGRWKVYFWWEPGGLFGINQDYVVNLMVHDGMTDVHEMGLTYAMEVYLNGQLVETRSDRSFPDGQGLEPIRFDERGSVRVVIKDIFDDASQQVNFSFQVAPEAVIKDIVPRHNSFKEGNVPKYLEGYAHPHHYNYLSGEFFMTTTDDSSKQDRLRVSGGDTVYIEYEDLTLPKPYTTADRLTIVAKALVVDSGVAPDGTTEIYLDYAQ